MYSLITEEIAFFLKSFLETLKTTHHFWWTPPQQPENPKQGSTGVVLFKVVVIVDDVLGWGCLGADQNWYSQSQWFPLNLPCQHRTYCRVMRTPEGSLWGSGSDNLLKLTKPSLCFPVVWRVIRVDCTSISLLCYSGLTHWNWAISPLPKCMCAVAFFFSTKKINKHWQTLWVG